MTLFDTLTDERKEELKQQYMEQLKQPYMLSLFKGRCGHQWVGASHGSFECPICGDHDGDYHLGDHHLVSVEPIAVQADDFGLGSEFS